jgi:hypothetical protein
MYDFLRSKTVLPFYLFCLTCANRLSVLSWPIHCTFTDEVSLDLSGPLKRDIEIVSPKLPNLRQYTILHLFLDYRRIHMRVVTFLLCRIHGSSGFKKIAISWAFEVQTLIFRLPFIATLLQIIYFIIFMVLFLNIRRNLK